MNQEEQGKKMNRISATDPRFLKNANAYWQVVAKAWADDAFKERLMANSAEVLREHGVDVPQGTEVKLVEGKTDAEMGAGLMVLPLPSKPSSEEMSDIELDSISGGGLGDGNGTCYSIISTTRKKGTSGSGSSGSGSSGSW